MNIISNLKSMFLYLVGFQLFIVFVGVLKVLSKKFQRFTKIYKMISDRLFFNVILRSLLEGYMVFCGNSMLNIYALKWTSRFDIFSSTLALTIFSVCMAFPILILLLLQSKFSQLGTDYNKNTFGAIYADIRLDSRVALLQNVMFVARRFIFCGVALILHDYPYFQIQVLIFTSLLTIVFIGLVKPFETKKLNIIEIINETCILGASYHLLVFTDYVSNDDIQYMCGWSLIGLTLFNMLVNIVIIMRETILNLKKNLIKLKLMAIKFYHKHILPKIQSKNQDKVQVFNSTEFQLFKETKVQEQMNDMGFSSQKPLFLKEDYHNKLINHLQNIPIANYKGDQLQRTNTQITDGGQSIYSIIQNTTIKIAQNQNYNQSTEKLDNDVLHLSLTRPLEISYTKSKSILGTLEEARALEQKENNANIISNSSQIDLLENFNQDAKERVTTQQDAQNKPSQQAKIKTRKVKEQMTERQKQIISVYVKNSKMKKI